MRRKESRPGGSYRSICGSGESSSSHPLCSLKRDAQNALSLRLGLL